MARQYVFVADDISASSYYRPFQQFGELINNPQILWDFPEKINLVVFTGGADINPKIYNDKPSLKTFTYTPRDMWEYGLFFRANQTKLPIVGVCRGAQLLCALAGGKLYQHVEDHDEPHSCLNKDGDLFTVSSTHHQMMRPPSNAILLAWAHPQRSKVYIGGDNTVMSSPNYEPEVCFFPNINAVGIQYHPEIMSEKSDGFKYAAKVVKQYLGVEEIEGRRYFFNDILDDDDNTEIVI